MSTLRLTSTPSTRQAGRLHGSGAGRFGLPPDRLPVVGQAPRRRPWRTTAGLLAALAGGLSCGAAQAETLPNRKAGLWEVQIQSDKEPAITSRQCIDGKTDAQLQKAGRGMMAGNCSKEVMRREGAGYASESVCKLGNSTITSRGVITGDFSTEVKMVIDAQYAPPLMGTASSKTTVTQRWKGDCPADWKPGDMELPGLKQRMNVNQMPAFNNAR